MLLLPGGIHLQDAECESVHAGCRGNLSYPSQNIGVGQRVGRWQLAAKCSMNDGNWQKVVVEGGVCRALPREYEEVAGLGMQSVRTGTRDAATMICGVLEVGQDSCKTWDPLAYSPRDSVSVWSLRCVSRPVAGIERAEETTEDDGAGKKSQKSPPYQTEQANNTNKPADEPPMPSDITGCT